MTQPATGQSWSSATAGRMPTFVGSSSVTCSGGCRDCCLFHRLSSAPGGSARLEVALGFVGGAHGQDLMDAGWAAEVLPGSRVEAGEVLVHGDFGPNNLLFDLKTSEVVAVLDWEWAHVGQRIEDLAWCEWIVRMHHPKQVGALDSFFTGYGARPAWAERQGAMLARCQQLIEVCGRWAPQGDGVRPWQNRATVAAGWAE